MYEINLNNDNKVYMRFSKRYDTIAISIEAQLFKKLWKNTNYLAHIDVAKGNESTWINDYKYKWAELGFSKSKENPVPFADISYEVNIYKMSIIKKRFPFFTKPFGEIKHSISFSDGITRTIWLLCNGAKELPFSISTDDAYNLVKVFENEVKILEKL